MIEVPKTRDHPLAIEKLVADQRRIRVRARLDRLRALATPEPPPPPPRRYRRVARLKK